MCTILNEMGSCGKAQGKLLLTLFLLYFSFCFGFLFMTTKESLRWPDISYLHNEAWHLK